MFLAQDGGWEQDYRNHLRTVGDSSQGRFTLVAEDAGTIVGYVACQINAAKPTAEVDILAVREGHRAKGVASELCRTAFARMRDANCAAVWLGHRIGSSPAHDPLAS